MAALLVGAFLMVALVPARLDAEAAERPSIHGIEPARIRADLGTALLDLTNADRAAYRLPALEGDEGLARYAERHSHRMAELGYLFHSDDERLRSALEGSGWVVAGENVGVGQSLQEIQRAFLQSPAHRDNLLGRGYDRVAIGVVEAGGVLWITVIFSGS
jgi:uncharacterized protein YkwD